MKIENLTSQINKIQTGKEPDSKAVSGSDFQTILKNRLQKVTNNIAVNSSQKVDTPTNFNPELRLQSLSTSEAAINTLDSYKEALANLNLKGPHLESYIEDLEEKTLALTDLKENLPQGDPLEQLVDRVAALSYVETVKYRRGDY